MSTPNKQPKMWEKAWSYEEIINNADNWNLAGDAALLNTLKLFSENILQKTTEIHNKVDGLCNQLDEADLKLKITFNDFNSLKHTQFVESRVYEEDISVNPEEKQAPSVEVTEENKLANIDRAISLSLGVLDKYYVKTDVPLSESEDEDDDDYKGHVLQPKDPYINRPLPYVIGSEEWNKKWHVGLEESSDSENEAKVEEQFEDSDTESEFNCSLSKTQLTNQSNSSSEIDYSVKESDNNSRGISSTSESDKAGKTTDNFAEQLAQKLGHVIQEKKQINVSEEPINKRPIQKATYENKNIGNIFFNEPPPIDDFEEGISAPKNDLFSGGEDLFNDENDDFWGHKKVPNPNEKSSAIFPTTTNNVSSGQKVKDIFDESDTEEDFLTSNYKIPEKKSLLPDLSTNKAKIPAQLFSDEPPELGETESEKKKPFGGVSVSGTSNIMKDEKFAKLLKNRRMSSTDEDSNTESKSSSDKEIQKTPKVAATTKSTSNKVVAKENKNKTIEENKSQEEIKIDKTEAIKESEKHPIKVEEKPKDKKVNLFDDVDDFGDDLFSNIDKKFNTNIFDDDFLTKDLFGSKNKALFDETPKQNKKTENNVDKITQANKNISKDKKNEVIEQKTKIEDIFGETSTKAIDLFADIENSNDDDIFESLSKNKSLFNPLDNKDTKSDNVKSEPTNLNNTKTDKAPKNIETPKETSNLQNIFSKEVSIPKVEDLFTENNEDDLFSSPSFTPKKKTLNTQVDETKNIINQEDTSKVVDKSNALEKSNKIQIEPVSKTIENIISPERNLAQPSTSEKTQQKLPPHISFLEATPPDDDIWETNSDNAFEDTDQTPQDIFNNQSQQHSSLFDREPPSLDFNDTREDSSGIFHDQTNAISHRISCNSFDPDNNLTSTRRLSSDIFTDEQFNDSLFVTKNKDQSTSANNVNTLDSIPETQNASQTEDFTDITPSGMPEDLYTSEDSTKTKISDFSGDLTPVKKSENIEESKEVLKVNNDDEQSNAKALPGKLKHNLNINVSALLPGGGKAPSIKNIQKQKESPEKIIEKNNEPLEEKKLAKVDVEITQNKKEEDHLKQLALTAEKPENNPPIQIDEADNVKILESITKGRAKIPIKRRPSTRRARQEQLKKSVPDFGLHNESIDQESTETIVKSKSENSIFTSSKTENIPSLETDVHTETYNKIKDDIRKKIDTPSANLFGDYAEVKYDLFDDKRNAESDIKSNAKGDLFGDVKNVKTEPEKDIFADSATAKAFPKDIKAEDDLFGSIKPTSVDIFDDFATKTNKNVLTSTSEKNIFSSSNESESKGVTKPQTATPNTTKTETKTPKKPPSKGLFDSSSDDEDFLQSFSKTAKKAKDSQVLKTNQKEIKKVSLFDDDEDDDLFGSSNSKNANIGIKKSVIEKHIPKATSLKKENISKNEDPLSALLK